MEKRIENGDRVAVKGKPELTGVVMLIVGPKAQVSLDCGAYTWRLRSELEQVEAPRARFVSQTAMDDMRGEAANDDRERMIETIMECEGVAYSEAARMYEEAA
jgi:hypothetical protein